MVENTGVGGKEKVENLCNMEGPNRLLLYILYTPIFLGF